MIRILLLFAFIMALRWLIFRFIIPIMKMTRMTNQKMNDLNKKMNQNPEGKTKRKPRNIEGEYIDYEEVKE